MPARRTAEAATSGNARQSKLAGGRNAPGAENGSVDAQAVLVALRASQTIVLEDFPDPKTARALSPNGRAHWARKHEAKRQVATRLAVEAITRRVLPVDGPVALTFRWVFPTQGRHDVDNLIATAKPLIDSLVEVGILEDDDCRHVVTVAAQVRVEKGRRALEIEIAPAGREVS